MHKSFSEALLPRAKDKVWQKAILKAVEQLMGFDFFDLKWTAFCTCPLSFYPGFELLRISSFSSVPSFTLHFVFRNTNELFQITGNKDCFEKLNPYAGLLLSQKTIMEYCKFYMGSLQAEDGSFFVVENMGEFDFTEQVEPVHLNAIRKHLCPARIEETPQGYIVHTFVNYFTFLFKAELSLNQDGIIDIVSEEVVAENLPTKIFRLL